MKRGVFLGVLVITGLIFWVINEDKTTENWYNDAITSKQNSLQEEVKLLEVVEEVVITESEEELVNEDFETMITWGAVEDDYFSDAVFIGDSRTVGLLEYGGLQEVSTFYASTGLSIYKLWRAEFDKKLLEELLAQQQYKKIYIMLGINELGTGTAESFANRYLEAIIKIQELQPEAIIYIQSILHVTKERSEKEEYVTNEEIDVRNCALEALANNENIFYLDVNSVLSDEENTLNEEYTSDGIHLKAKYISIWKDFLKENAVMLD